MGTRYDIWDWTRETGKHRTNTQWRYLIIKDTWLRTNKLIMMTGKPKYGHKRNGNTRHRETGLILIPPPQRCVPRHATSNGEAGWAHWMPQGTRRQDRRPPGRCPFRDPWRSRELGRPWRSWEPWRAAMASLPPRPRPQPLPRPLRLVPYYPPKNVLGGSRGSIGHSRGKCGHLGML